VTNFPADKVEMVKRPNHPKDASMGESEMPFSRILYIDRADFQKQESKDYKGLTPKQGVHLKYGWVLRFGRISKLDGHGEPEEIEVTVDMAADVRSVEGHISWVAQPSPGKEPLKVSLRLYDVLFKSKEPMKIKKEEMASLGYKDWIDDLNLNSLVVAEAWAEPSVALCKAGEKLQGERMAFFCCDPDSTKERLVFNRTCALKASI